MALARSSHALKHTVRGGTTPRHRADGSLLQNVLERGRLKHHEQGVALEVALGADQPTARPRARGTPLNLGEAVAQAYGADLYIKSHDDSGYSGHSGCPASEASSRG